MHSPELTQRLEGIQKALTALCESGAGMTTATRGREREQFIDIFLSRVLPPGYRFGTRDAIDTHGHRSGQLDVVVEFTFFPSLPGLVGQPRLYTTFSNCGSGPCPTCGSIRNCSSACSISPCGLGTLLDLDLLVDVHRGHFDARSC